MSRLGLFVEFLAEHVLTFAGHSIHPERQQLDS